MPFPPTVRFLSILLPVFALGVWTGRSLFPAASSRAGVPASAAGEPSAAAGPAAGLAAAGGPPAGSARTAAEAVPSLSALPPAEARARLKAITSPEVRAAAIRQCLVSMPVEKWNGWMQEFFAAGGREPEKIDFSARAEYYSLINDFFAGITAVDPVGFMAVQTSKGERNNDSETAARVMVMMKWAETDPAAARAFLTAQLSGEHPMPGLSDAAQRMAGVLARRGDPAGVVEWAATLPEQERAAATSAALGEMAFSDPRAASRLLEKVQNLPGLNTGTLRLNAGNLAAEIAESLARTAPAEALAWAAAQTGAMREKGLNGALKNWADRDFDAALAAVRGLEAEARSTGFSALLGKAKPERLGEMALLVEAQPDSPGRAAASARVMAAWTQHSPEQASEWMARQPAGEIRDSAISAFVRWADVRDPEAGLLWAGSMSDAAKRMEAITHIIRQLGPKAPETVRPWLDNTAASSLSAEERAQITQKLDAPP